MKETALEIAKQMLGIKYKWGGKNPIEGFDCSGFIIEVLQSVGILPEKGDWTAHDLASKWPAEEMPKRGHLVFYDWNKDGIIDHVEMVIAEPLIMEYYSISARDGDKSVINEEEARKKSAYIKIRPLRKGWIKVVDPFKE